MKKTNFITIGIFTLCLSFSFNTLANPGRVIKEFFDSFRKNKSVTPLEEINQPSGPTPEEIEEFSRRKRQEELDSIDGVSIRAVNHNAIFIDEQFN